MLPVMVEDAGICRPWYLPHVTMEEEPALDLAASAHLRPPSHPAFLEHTVPDTNAAHHLQDRLQIAISMAIHLLQGSATTGGNPNTCCSKRTESSTQTTQDEKQETPGKGPPSGSTTPRSQTSARHRETPGRLKLKILIQPLDT